jgi:hypothetical protein
MVTYKKEPLQILGRKINDLHEWGNSQLMLSEYFSLILLIFI